MIVTRHNQMYFIDWLASHWMSTLMDNSDDMIRYQGHLWSRPFLDTKREEARLRNRHARRCVLAR